MEINLAIQENINVMSEKIRLKNLGIKILELISKVSA